MKLFALCLLASAALAQNQNSNEKRMNCEDNRHNGKQAHTCKIVEQEIASIGRLAVDAGNNGGVSVRGWAQKQTLVRAKIEAYGETEADANALASQVHSDNVGGQIKANGPRSHNSNNSWWTVSYEVFVPYATDLNLLANNGGITIVDVRGRLEFKTNNGGVNLARIAGDVNGETKNGGIHVDLAGSRYEGNQFEVRTQNGGIHLGVPSNYSARIQSETVNGAIRSDFPLPSSEEKRPRLVDLTLGGGGTLIHVSTRNGGVSVKKI
jgi:DUF4097 and DUF4098 domain-containing protein YvlB